MTLFADVNLSTEGIVLVSGLLSALAGALVVIFKLLMKAQQDRFDLAIQQLEDQRKSYKEIAEEAVKVAEKKAGSKVPKLAAVVPEHNSPATRDQKETAELTDLRARVTAVTLAAGMPPRESQEPVVPVAAIEELKKVVTEAPEKIANKVVEKVVSEVADRVAEKIHEDRVERSPQSTQDSEEPPTS